MSDDAPIQPGEDRDTAIPKLLDQHGAQLHALAVRLCRSRDDADDLLQEIFLNAYRKWEQFEGRSSPTTWLFTIAARACQRLHRKRSGEPKKMASLEELLPFDEKQLPVLPGDGNGPEQASVQRELIEHLEEGIAALPVAFRIPLVLKDVIGLSVADVATALRIKEATVKTRLHRARLQLRRALVSRLPARDGQPAAYPKRVCLDLLSAKQEALDRGSAFPVGDDVICERCRAVFGSLDFTRDTCRRIAAGELPPRLRTVILNGLK